MQHSRLWWMPHEDSTRHPHCSNWHTWLGELDCEQPSTISKCTKSDNTPESTAELQSSLTKASMAGIIILRWGAKQTTAQEPSSAPAQTFCPSKFHTPFWGVNNPWDLEFWLYWTCGVGRTRALISAGSDLISKPQFRRYYSQIFWSKRYLVLVEGIECHTFFDGANTNWRRLFQQDNWGIYRASDLNESSSLTFIELAHETLTRSNFADLQSIRCIAG